MRVIQTERDAVAFMRSAKLALRYGSSAALPLPSIYSGAIDKRRAIELTNALLARADVVETNVIAGRLVLVWRELVPALYALRVRFRGRLSADATRALELIRKGKGVNVGEVRRLLGVTGARRPDRADDALAELMRDMLVDRGQSSVPERGIPYLSREGFPYRCFEEAHPQLVRRAGTMSIARAMADVVEPLRQVAPRRLATILKLCATKDEIESAQK